MYSGGFGFEEEEGDDEDAATQCMIEQSLMESCKPRDVHRETTRTSEEDMRKNPKPDDKDQIFTAIRQGNEKLVKELCKRQTDRSKQTDRFEQTDRQTDRFEQTDSRGWIPLHEAAAQSNQNILELVFEASGPGSVDKQTGSGQTPLFLSVDRGLTSGPGSVDKQTGSGQTPLFLSVDRGLIENAAFLLKQGAKVDIQDNKEDSALFIAIRSSRSDLVKLLLSHGSRINQQAEHGRRPLHEASRSGNDGLVSLLLEGGAELDPSSHYGLTPLALAAQGGHLEVVQRLLDRGADVLSQAHDEASILYEACCHGDPAMIRLLLEYGADANVEKHSGHLPIHRLAARGHIDALNLLIPVTCMEDVKDSGMSPLHSAASAGHTHCIKALLDAGYDPNYMLLPWVRRNYSDERKSALFFAVSNDDVPSTRLLLESGAMPNQDPIKCLQVALRQGNHELIHLMLRFGANANYYCQINTTHFPSALQYAMKDEVILRMLCNHGYDVSRCFDCPYGNRPHIPEGFEGWTDTVIKDTLFCEVITVRWLKHLSGSVVLILLDYSDHVTLCSKLKTALMEQRQWTDICTIQENPRSLQHLCRLRVRLCLGRLRLRSPVFMSDLPLPRRLKDYVTYSHYDLHGNEN